MQSPGHRRLSQTNTQSVAATPRTSLTVDGRMNLSGGAMAYTVGGTGPTVLLIHGLGGTRQTWRHLIAPLARNHTVIAPIFPAMASPTLRPVTTRSEPMPAPCVTSFWRWAISERHSSVTAWAEVLHYKPRTSFLNAPIASC